MNQTARYTVTEAAGPKVAGRRALAGDTLELTENAARAELLAGAIVPAESVSAETMEVAEPVSTETADVAEEPVDTSRKRR